ncbi:ABC-type sugar transport system substrate-binding protein [Mycoplasmoides fastidiosum]|uniref:ABC-type sugar transport system substrate-binding protein n=1 Tax=Mycoplasmoides fastidiosum TaxID=92758 RepID=A0ABU0LZI5_9BACT|nr:substrate-binding domain-containing protein [Mycoplasmoides fastidiosum]MDQ0514111.1 ABC-type sugar transport system substrate-binding protein [Mycoplasmoides fastidiosum]UUD37481.1 substrate-binding domain-containing protein [Mycoplasmoides fastidiosum]
MSYFSKRMAKLALGFGVPLSILAIALGIVGGTVTRSNAPIAVLLSSRNNPFFQQVANGIDIYAQKFGYQVQYFDSENSVERENAHIRSIIAAGFKMVLFNDVNEQSGVNAVKALNQANIPVIAVDHVLVPEELKAKENNQYQIDDNFKVIANIASDNFQAGEILAVYASQVLRIPYNTRSFTLYGIPGTASSDQRMRGFIREINDGRNRGHYGLAAVGFNLSYDNGFGFQADDNRSKANLGVQNNIQRYFTPSSPEFSPLLFATNDEAALGGIAALKSSGILAGSQTFADAGSNKTWVFGVDYTDDALVAIKNNEQSATVRQDTHLMGYMSMDIASYFLDPNLYGNKTAYGATQRYQNYDKTTFDYWLKRYPNRFSNDIDPSTTMQNGYYFKLNTSLTYWDLTNNDYKNVQQIKDDNGVSRLEDIGPAGTLSAADTPDQVSSTAWTFS